MSNLKSTKKEKATVFGGSGFLGSHTADFLTKKGWDVTIFDIKHSPHLKATQKMIVGDILDPEKVKTAVKGASVVYNFAGIADIEEASKNPIGTIKNNIIGNGNILEALKGKKIERYVFASTIYVYSDTGSFYKDSKLACEMYINDYHKTYGIPYTIVRYGSLYGPRTNKKDRIYRMVNQALKDGKITYEGDGEEMREYIHVEDAARCSVEILDEDYTNQIVIITGTQALKIKDLIVMINEIIGKNVRVELLNKTSNLHYEMTPYSFKPKLGKKYISKDYIDLGQGILQTIEEIYNSLIREK